MHVYSEVEHNGAYFQESVYRIAALDEQVVWLKIRQLPMFIYEFLGELWNTMEEPNGWWVHKQNLCLIFLRS